MPTVPEASATQVHPYLLEVFRLLDGSGLEWLLLRGEDSLDRPSGDVDILVAEPFRGRLDPALRALGFIRVAAPGHGGHRFYFRYSPADDAWIKLDIVSTLRFGTYQQGRLPLHRYCLSGRVRHGDFWLPDPSDQAWLYLLHLLLDKGGVASDRRDRAAAAGRLAAPGGVVAAQVDSCLGPGSAADILELAGGGSFRDSAVLGHRLRAAWREREPAAWAWRSARGILLRRVPPTVQGLPRRGSPWRGVPMRSVRRRGVTVGVMGPDGAGKTSLLAGLRTTFPVAAQYVYMGIWAGGPGEDRIRRIPGGRLATRSARILRGAAAAHWARLRGRVVLLDRVPHDTQLPGSIDKSFGGRVSAALAFAAGPAPDVLFTLDAPGEVMFARKGEHSPEQLEKWRQAYRDLAARLPGSHILDATASQDAMRREATDLVWQALAAGPAGATPASDIQEVRHG